jgi:copper chaperone CopZ
MKTVKIIALLAVLFLITPVSAQDNKTAKPKKSEEVTFAVSMHCNNCKAKIEKNISWEKGVKNIKVDLEKKTVKINYDPGKTSEEKLKKAIEKLDYTCSKPKNG